MVFDDFEMVETPPPPDPDSPQESSADHWRQVYEACLPGLRVFLRGRLGQEVDVDDCLQAVYVKMIQQSSKPGKEVAPVARRAWLFRVAANEAAGLWRRKASTDKMLRRHGGDDITQPDATEKLILTETTVKVRQAVQRLPEALQVVVRLRMEENLTFQQIASKLDIPLGTALTRMRRAIERLKNEIKPEDES